MTDVDADLRVYEAIWTAFAKTGVVEGAPTLVYVEPHFGELTDEQQTAARRAPRSSTTVCISSC